MLLGYPTFCSERFQVLSAAWFLNAIILCDNVMYKMTNAMPIVQTRKSAKCEVQNATYVSEYINA